MVLKAQTALEYFLIVGVVMAVLLPTWAYVSFVQMDAGYQLSMSYARNTASKIASMSDMVDSQGPPASVMTYVYVPDNVEEIMLRDKEINFRVRVPGGGTNDVYAITRANLNGSLPVVQGSYFVVISANTTKVDVWVV